MTIEKWSMLDRPSLSSREEGMDVAIERWQQMKKGNQLGAAMVTLLPEGEYNLLPHYLKGKGANKTMKVLEDGTAIIIDELSESTTIKMATGGESGVQMTDTKRVTFIPAHMDRMTLIFQSEDNSQLELHEIIFHKDGPNPDKEQIHFIDPVN